MLQFKIYGVGCRSFVADYFWNITCIENGNSVLAVGDSWEGRVGPFNAHNETTS